MLWFTKKEPEVTHEPWWASLWAGIKQKYPIGHRFDYLGVNLLVVSHFDGFYGMGIIKSTPPQIGCHYIDKHGIIQVYPFSIQEMSVLEKL